MESEVEKAEKKCAKLFEKIKKVEKLLDDIKKDYSQSSSSLRKLKETKCNEENKLKVAALDSKLDVEWIEREFPWTNKLKEVLTQTFGFENFKPKQLAAINATLSRNDVLLVMPTGGGKSLTYQLPALIDSGFSLIVSPLIALIEDQLIALKRVGIEAATINSNTARSEAKIIYENMQKDSGLKLLYVTPEWIAKSKRFMGILKKCYEANRIARVAIDEVHCCSTWGHDFRPDYGYLGIVRPMLSNVPFLGLTATATMHVLTDVQTMLGLEDAMIIRAPFNRPNLFYRVIAKPSTREQVAEYMARLLSKDFANQTGIIYTNTITESMNLSKDLRQRGLKVAPYYAQLEPAEKKKIHTKWLEKKYQAIVATLAFGMGIDKPDVRFVIHHTIPRSMESLYQESGRAGRDGYSAKCIVLFGLNDYLKVQGMVASVVDVNKALSVLEYCLDESSCRRAIIAKQFEETWNADQCEKMCDNCCESQDVDFYNLSNCCRDIHKIIDHAHSMDEKLTLSKLVDIWFQTGPKKLRISSLKIPVSSKRHAEVIIAFLLLKKFLALDKACTAYSTICYIIKGNQPDDKIEILSINPFVGISHRVPIIETDSNSPDSKKPRIE